MSNSVSIQQATLAPPAAGKMVKGLLMCYSVIFITFYSTAVSGYWVFGNKSNSNILESLMPDEGPALAPTWVLGLAVIFIILQLFAIALVLHTSFYIRSFLKLYIYTFIISVNPSLSNSMGGRNAF